MNFENNANRNKMMEVTKNPISQYIAISHIRTIQQQLDKVKLFATRIRIRSKQTNK